MVPPGIDCHMVQAWVFWFARKPLQRSGLRCAKASTRARGTKQKGMLPGFITSWLVCQQAKLSNRERKVAQVFFFRCDLDCSGSLMLIKNDPNRSEQQHVAAFKSKDLIQSHQNMDPPVRAWKLSVLSSASGRCRCWLGRLGSRRALSFGLRSGLGLGVQSTGHSLPSHLWTKWDLEENGNVTKHEIVLQESAVTNFIRMQSGRFPRSITVWKCCRECSISRLSSGAQWGRFVWESTTSTMSHLRFLQDCALVIFQSHQLLNMTFVDRRLPQSILEHLMDLLQLFGRFQKLGCELPTVFKSPQTQSKFSGIGGMCQRFFHSFLCSPG